MTPYDVLRAGSVAEGIAQLLHGNTAGFPLAEEYASLLSVPRRCWGPLAYWRGPGCLRRVFALVGGVGPESGG